jgi:putative transposase
MYKRRFTETQIVATLKQPEGGRHVKDVCRELEEQNSRLERMYADLAQENTALKDVIEGKL